MSDDCAIFIGLSLVLFFFPLTYHPGSVLQRVGKFVTYRAGLIRF